MITYILLFKIDGLPEYLKRKAIDGKPFLGSFENQNHAWNEIIVKQNLIHNLIEFDEINNFLLRHNYFQDGKLKNFYGFTVEVSQQVKDVENE